MRRGDPRDAGANPMVLLLFNANVDPAAAAKFVSWRNAEGQQMSARVEQADPSTDREENFYPWNSDDGSLATWSESMMPQFASRSVGDGVADEDEASPEPGGKQAPRPNILVVRPEHSLSPGKDWQVVLGAGLPSTEWKIGLPSEQKVMIGTVRPFELSSLTAESNRSEKRRIVAHFSKRLGGTISNRTVRDWFRLDPEPPNIGIEVSDSTVTFTGDFSLGSAYRVTVKSGLPASEPFTLPDEISKEVRFEKIAPRLYFEDFATHQLLHGTRRFRLLSVNGTADPVVRDFVPGRSNPRGACSLLQIPGIR